MRKLILVYLVWLVLASSLPTAVQNSPLQIAGVVSHESLALDSSRLTIQSVTVNDPLFRRQTTLKQIGIPAAWEVTTGSSAPVAVIDTGIDLRHEDLINKLWVNTDEIAGNRIDDDHNGYIDDDRGYNFIDHNSNLTDSNGHGTGIASIIAARTNNKIGMAGISWSSSIMVLKALDSTGGGNFNTVAEAIRYAVNNGARVINMSFGTTENVRVFEEVVNEAIAKNVIIVAAVGNNHTSRIFYPAAYPGVIAVSSIDDDGKLSVFSNYGSGVDIAAPGEDVVMAKSSTTEHDQYVAGSGSSFAAAEVTGTVALLLAHNSHLNVTQVTEIITATADPLSGDDAKKYFGAGRIDAGAALAYQSKTLTATLSFSNQQPVADGLANTIVTALITDEFGQPQTNSPITIKLSGSANIINNQLVSEGSSTAVGMTDPSGRISFVIASPLAETKQIFLFAGASPITISGSSIVIFRPLAFPRYTMRWLRQSPSVVMPVNSTTKIWVEIQNTGNVVWASDRQSTTSRGVTRLGTSNPLDRNSGFHDPETWASFNRSSYMTPNLVRPGETARFEFTIRANHFGQFREYFRPVIDYVKWLPDYGIYWDINVTAANSGTAITIDFSPSASSAAVLDNPSP